MLLQRLQNVINLCKKVGRYERRLIHDVHCHVNGMVMMLSGIKNTFVVRGLQNRDVTVLDCESKQVCFSYILVTFRLDENCTKLYTGGSCVRKKK